MRVLMVGWELPPKISGGLGVACYGMTKGLYELGEVEVTFLIPHAATCEDDRFVQLNALGLSKVETTAVPNSSSYGNNLFSQVDDYADKMSEFARKDGQWDVIHAHDWLTVPAALELKRITGKPLVLHIHSTEYDRSGPNASAVIIDIEQQGLDAADSIVAVSNYTRDILVDRYRQNPQKVAVIYNAIDEVSEPLSRDSSMDRLVNVAFLGRITYQKGPGYFIEAASIALRMRPGLRFVMGGDGDLLCQMKKLAIDRGIAEYLYFPGFLKGDEARHLLRNSEIYVMPSVSEPFGISALEAIQEGAVVIASCQSGVAEVVTNLVTFEYWDVDTLASKIVCLHDDISRMQMMKIDARREILGLTWTKAARQLREIYRRVLDGQADGYTRGINYRSDEMFDEICC